MEKFYLFWFILNTMASILAAVWIFASLKNIEKEQERQRDFHADWYVKLLGYRSSFVAEITILNKNLDVRLSEISNDLNAQSTEFLRLHVALADVKDLNSTVIADIDRNFQKNIDALINAKKSSESSLDSLKGAFKKTGKVNE